MDGEEVGPVRPGDFIQRPRISFDFAAEFRSPLDVKDVAVGPPVFTFASPALPVGADVRRRHDGPAVPEVDEATGG